MKDSSGRNAPTQSPTSDRETVISRSIDAPRELVFEAFTKVRHLSRWWGPEGFTTTTRSFEFRVDGVWDFVMHGPDGTDYPEWITWTELTPPARIAMLHGEYRGDPNAFESIITFEADGETTLIEMRTVFQTKELRDEAVEKFGAVEGEAGRRWAAWPPTLQRSRGQRRRADGRPGALQRVDVAGRLHRARLPRRVTQLTYAVHMRQRTALCMLPTARSGTTAPDG